MPTKQPNAFSKRGTSKDLVIIVHGFRGAGETMKHVKERVETKNPDADTYTPTLPHHYLLNSVPIVQIVLTLIKAIDSCWEERQTRNDKKSYENIILVGTSIGGLIIRKLYIYACGQNINAPFEKGVPTDPKPWAAKVERLILLAGMNRGWSISPHLSYKSAISYTVGLFIAKAMQLIIRKRSSMLDVRRGAPFITELRAQWIYMRRTKIGNALTIQLLGSIDDLVSPEDNIDLVSGADFIYLDVPNSSHKSIVQMNAVDEEGKTYIDGENRAEIFITALTETSKELEDRQEIPADSQDLIQARENVDGIVFVIHGIRDEGFWTHKIARRIIGRAKKQNPPLTFASETSSYGYFPIIDFLYPKRRQKKVEWLMDQYIEALALYPNAEFYYVGHSNGTYLLAKALEDYRCCRFKNVVFGSSVVPSTYDWDKHIKNGKVDAMLNYTATADWIVAGAPYFFETAGILGLGGAGHVGFKSEKIHSINYIKGGHSASMTEPNWNSIADFILKGPPKVEAENIIEDKQPRWVRIFSPIARFGGGLILIVGVFGILGWVLWFLINSGIDRIGDHQAQISHNNLYDSFKVMFSGHYKNLIFILFLYFYYRFILWFLRKF